MFEHFLFEHFLFLNNFQIWTFFMFEHFLCLNFFVDIQIFVQICVQIVTNSKYVQI
jgi:hypothetical protein